MSAYLPSTDGMTFPLSRAPLLCLSKSCAFLKAQLEHQTSPTKPCRPFQHLLSFRILLSKFSNVFIDLLLPFNWIVSALKQIEQREQIQQRM